MLSQQDSVTNAWPIALSRGPGSRFRIRWPQHGNPGTSPTTSPDEQRTQFRLPENYSSFLPGPPITQPVMKTGGSSIRGIACRTRDDRLNGKIPKLP